MHDAAAVDREVHGRRDEPGVLECLEHRRHPRRQMPCVHVHERIAHRLPDPCRAQRAEGRSVLDEAPFSAVVPDEVRNPMDVRACARGDRGQTDGRERGEDRDGATIRAVLDQPGEGRRVPLLDRRFERRRAQPVDDHDDELGSSSCRELRCRGRWTARGKDAGSAHMAIWVRPRTLHHTVQRRSGDTRTRRETSSLVHFASVRNPRAAQRRRRARSARAGRTTAVT